MQLVGLAAIVVAVSGLLGAYFRSARRSRFGVSGWIGLTAVVGSTAYLASPLDDPAGLVPLAWTGYVLAVDAAVFATRGQSLIRSRPESFVWLVVLSVFLWIPFEWYNLRLAGWYRAGLPNGLVRYLFLGWAFACAWPALFETADLLLSTSRPATTRHRCPCTVSFRAAGVPMMAGTACLAVPLMVPRLDLGEHLLALAGVGFLLVLDPWNAVRGHPSLWRDCLRGRPARLTALATSGLVCGLLMDGLNGLTLSGWHCLWSPGPSFRMFELPVAAYVLLPFFGAQAFAMHVFATRMLGLPTAQLPSCRTGGEWSAPVSGGFT